MTTSITIRDVPDETRDELAARAAATGRSLQEYLRSRLIDLARQPDAEALLAEVRARKAATAAALPLDRIRPRIEAADLAWFRAHLAESVAQVLAEGIRGDGVEEVS